MALRLIEVVCPEEHRQEVQQLAEDSEPKGLWHDALMDEQVMVTILLAADKAESVLDRLENRFAHMEGVRIVLLPVEAAVPREEEPEEGESSEREAQAEGGRVSRQELYEDIAGRANLTRVYVVLVLLSTLVAAIGMWRDNVAVVIGAMVIAPLLGPNMALAFANAMGDTKLLRRALKTGFVAIGVALTLAVLIGIVLPISFDSGQMASRSEVAPSDIALGLAAGCAGALAVAGRLSSALVGVMVAVALLPPLVALGLALGSAQWAVALGAGLLFLANLICINLAAVATFLAQGIRPRTWLEKDRAKKAARRALALWFALLLALVAAIIFGQGRIKQIVLAKAAGPGPVAGMVSGGPLICSRWGRPRRTKCRARSAHRSAALST